MTFVVILSEKNHIRISNGYHDKATICSFCSII